MTCNVLRIRTIIINTEKKNYTYSISIKHFLISDRTSSTNNTTEDFMCKNGTDVNMKRKTIDKWNIFDSTIINKGKCYKS